MKRIGLTIAMIALVVGFGLPSMHTQTKDPVLIVTGEWEPYTGSKMENLGFFSEIAAAVFKEAGIPVKIEFYPWLRCEKLVQDGTAFATFPYIVTDERLATYKFTDPVANSTGRFFYVKGTLAKEPTWKTWADLKGFTIGVPLGYWCEKPMKDAGLSVQDVSNDETNFKMLQAGRVQMIVCDELVGWQIIKRLFPKEVDKFAVVTQPLNDSELRLMVGPKYPKSTELLAEFNAALKRIKDKGIYAEILKKYGLKR
jgi:polar amino acid transport system substrate-binding protein